MNYQLTWSGHPVIDCTLSGETTLITAAESNVNTHIGFFETESDGALYCRHAEIALPGGQWSVPIAVPEPGVSLSAAVLFVVILLARGLR